MLRNETGAHECHHISVPKQSQEKEVNRGADNMKREHWQTDSPDHGEGGCRVRRAAMETSSEMENGKFHVSGLQSTTIFL